MKNIMNDSNQKPTEIFTRLSENILIKNFLNPGLSLPEDSFEQLITDLKYINHHCRTPLNYGIFTPDLELEAIREKLKSAFVAITYIDNEPICANHGFIFTSENLQLPIFYFGLTQNNSGLKMDLTGAMHTSTLQLLSKHFQEAMASTISIHAKIAEAFDQMAESAYPSPFYKSKRPPRGYAEYAKEVINFYAKPCWSHLGEVQFDSNSFVVSIDNKSQTGFISENYKDMIKAEDWFYDLFMQHKIDWQEQQDLLFLGKVTSDVYENANQHYQAMLNTNQKKAA